MSGEQQEKKEQCECRVTIQFEGAEACCGAGDPKARGKQRVIKVVCCPPEEKKEQ